MQQYQSAIEFNLLGIFSDDEWENRQKPKRKTLKMLKKNERYEKAVEKGQKSGIKELNQKKHKMVKNREEYKKA